MTDIMPALTRATGIVATVLVVAALVWGFFFSARETGQRLHPAWWLDLHNWLGGLSLVFTGLHIVASWLDSNSGVGLVQIFVPGTASAGWAITWGVLATYLFSVVVFTSWPKRMKRRTLWRVIHLTSIGGAVLALVHAYQIGTDASTLAFRTALIALVGLGVYAGGLRLFAQLEKALRRA